MSAAVKWMIGRTARAATGLVVILVLLPLLLDANPARPRPASADFCLLDDLANFSIHFREGSASGPDVQSLGFQVTISPNPLTFDHDGTFTAIDNGLNDDDDDFPITGHIVIDDICQTDHPGFTPGSYTLLASITPGSAAAAQGCRIPNPRIAGQTITGPEGSTKEVDFVVSCGGAAQATPPGQAGPAPTGVAPSGASPPGVVAGQPTADARPPVRVVPKIEFDVHARAAEEIPAVSVPASALARFEFDPNTNDLWFFVTVSGVSRNLVSHAAIHRGGKDVNGPAIRYLSHSGFTQIEGTIALSDGEVSDLLAGNLYIRIGSAIAGSGLARGQLVVPATRTLDR